MTKLKILIITAILTVAAVGETNIQQTFQEDAASSTTNQPEFITLQEILVTGHSNLKLNSLAIISQEQMEVSVDESFLPGFKVCSEDPAIPVRRMTARLLGECFVEGKEDPNPEAMALLVKLAQDESNDVQTGAIHYGLTPLRNKPSEIVELLLEYAAENREEALYQRIADSLDDNREEAADILDRLLEQENPISYVEIYEDMTGKKPADVTRFLDLPSSRPKLFVFKGNSADSSLLREELKAELNAIGLKNPALFIAGSGADYVLLLKTYITKDRMAVEGSFSGHLKFDMIQEMWLTPELEIQMDSMVK